MRSSPYSVTEKRLMLIGLGELTPTMADSMDKEEINELWTKITSGMEELDIEELERFIPV